jgi:hypothetical protein
LLLEEIFSVFENRVLREVFELSRVKITGK